MAASGFGAILLTLGIYLLIRVFRWEKTIAVMWDEIKSGFLTGKLSIYTYILSIVVLIVFGIFAYYNTNFNLEVALLPLLSFLNNMVWGIVIAGLIVVFGRVIDIYVRDKRSPWTYWLAPFSLLAFGFVSSAVFQALYKSLINWPQSFNATPFLTISFIGYTSTGVMIALVGAITYHYIKELYLIEEKKLEIEKQTAQLLDKS